VALLSLGSRFFLAFVFLAASVPKLKDTNDFRRAVLGYAVVPDRLAKQIAVSLPRVELGVAVALIAGIVLPIAALAAGTLLVAMAVVVAVNLGRGRTIDCGCFGRSAPRRISWSLVAQNLGLTLVAGFVAVHPAGFQLIDLGPTASGPTAAETLAVGVAAAAAVVTAGLVGAIRRAGPVLSALASAKQVSP
jgi:hypothetical protein